MTSIRYRLTIRLLLTLGITMAAVAIALFFGVRAALLRQFDATLEARLASLESALRWDGSRVDLDFVPDAMPWYGAGTGAEYFTVSLVGDGAGPALPVGQSPSLGSGTLVFPADLGKGVANARLPDGRDGRIATRLVKPSPEEDLDLPGKEREREGAIASTPQVRVTVAMGRHPLDATLATIAVSLLLAGGALAFGLVLATRHALARGLAPLDAFSRSIEEVHPEALSQRVPGGDIPEELRSVHARLNELIERLDVAFQRERRFASAAAHELRTPVAELRSLLEVAVSRPRSAAEAAESMSEALDITLRLNRLIGALLSLARAPTIRDIAQLEVIEPWPIVVQVLRRYEEQAATRGGGIELKGGEAVVVRADPASLESILANVISNAVEYAKPAPWVRCEVFVGDPGTVCIDVVNPAKHVTAEDVEHFFEPFWRRSPSRSDHAHAGLGLAVARALALGMGADVKALLEGDDVRIRVELRWVQPHREESENVPLEAEHRGVQHSPNGGA